MVATAGESLSGYRIYLYNGNSPSAAVVYANTAVPAGTVVSCGSQVRMATVSYASNGVQNGPNDGVALVDPNGQLVQFLSYEGAITGSGGPAAGVTSQNLPVSESNSTAVGSSLQLTGTGSSAANFSWAGSAAQTFGACNRARPSPAATAVEAPVLPPSAAPHQRKAPPAFRLPAIWPWASAKR